MTYVPVDIEEAIKRECRRRRYSERMAKTYIYCINRFLKFTGKTASPNMIKIKSPIDDL